MSWSLAELMKLCRGRSNQSEWAECMWMWHKADVKELITRFQSFTHQECASPHLNLSVKVSSERRLQMDSNSICPWMMHVMYTVCQDLLNRCITYKKAFWWRWLLIKLKLMISFMTVLSVSSFYIHHSVPEYKMTSLDMDGYFSQTNN